MSNVAIVNETRIGDLRRARGWTQERLAAESGVAVRTIQRLEAGKDASLETVSLIADALEVPVGELFAHVEKNDFGVSLDGLDARKTEQQERRDSVTHAFDTLFRGVGILVVFATVALALSGLTNSWLIWLVIPAYWAGARYVARSVFHFFVSPRLDEKYPLSVPTRRGGRAA